MAAVNFLFVIVVGDTAHIIAVKGTKLFNKIIQCLGFQLSLASMDLA